MLKACDSCEHPLLLAGTLVCAFAEKWFFFRHELPEIGDCTEYAQSTQDSLLPVSESRTMHSTGLK
jgi:hypothetical protein